MADSTPQPPATPEPAKRSRSLGLVMAIGFTVVVIIVECAIAYLVIPTADDIAELANVQLAMQEDPNSLENEIDRLTEGDAGDQVEVDLGQFGVTAFQPLSNTTLRIDLQLYCTVLEDNESEFTELVELHKHRLREQVLIVLRSAKVTDLTDAGLGLIKRKILEKTNRTIGKPLVQDIVFSDFSVVEH